MKLVNVQCIRCFTLISSDGVAEEADKHGRTRGRHKCESCGQEMVTYEVTCQGRGKACNNKLGFLTWHGDHTPEPHRHLGFHCDDCANKDKNVSFNIVNPNKQPATVLPPAPPSPKVT